LRKLDPHLEVVYIGQAAGIEAELARAAGLPFKSICGGKFRRLPGAGLWRNLLQLDNLLFNLRDIVLIAIGTVQAWWILRKLRPQAVFNKAGPTGFPVGLACRRLGIPMVIHEPDIIPGANNRMLSRWAAAVAVGFPVNLYSQLPASKLHHTGNPVGAAILGGSKATAIAQFNLDTKRPVVVVVGGSQGALAINQAVAVILPELVRVAQVVQVAGREGYTEAQTAAAKQHIGTPEGYHVVPFLPAAELGALYQAATIVVARAGANTIAELAALAKPVIMLPNHQSAAHQIANAKWLAKAGAAIMLPDEQPQPLLAAITELLTDSSARKELAAHIARCNVADAPERLAALVMQAAGQRP
jgi:UDP-N-acetylglucosamine--N-acetylmuramyl-(pentapeptide) pyrophosphoryl-undecaprenol N-acetylglucosamine transferase